MSSMSPLEQALGLKDTLDALLLVLAGIEERGIPGIVQQIDDAALRASSVADEIRRQNDQAGDITGALSAVRQQLDAILATADEAVVQRLLSLLQHPELEAGVAMYHKRLALNLALDLSDERLRRVLTEFLAEREQVISRDITALAEAIDSEIATRQITEFRFAEQDLQMANEEIIRLRNLVYDADVKANAARETANQAVTESALLLRKLRESSSMAKQAFSVAISGSLFMSVGFAIGMYLKPIIA